MTASSKRLRLLLVLSVAGIGVVGATTAHALTASGSSTALAVYRLHEVDTSVVPVDNPPSGSSAGDLLMFTARVSSAGKRFGRYVGSCAYVTKTEIFCSIELNVFGRGRIELAGELSTQQANSVFAVTGGTGQFMHARGYLTNHQASTGTSADQVLYLDAR
jgi:hypothetical protein